MSTRHSKLPNVGPWNQERYLSSPEFAELHGLSGVAVSQRAALLIGDSKKSLVWFLQGLSLKDGGLKRVGAELIEMFPERLSTSAMRKHGAKNRTSFDARISSSILMDLEDYTYGENNVKSLSMAEAVRKCENAARHGFHQDGHYHSNQVPSLAQFLFDLCINPCINIRLKGEDEQRINCEIENAKEEFGASNIGGFSEASLPYFDDIIGALFEYKGRYETKRKADFQTTAIADKIWETLEFGLKAHKMVLLDGLEGRGKTEAVKAWCECHLGLARYLSLKGVTSKTAAFREIAKALGIASSYSRTATEMQARIEDVLRRSKLMLVIDEAHFLFNQSQRIYTRPELIDWIDTALCNQGVPVGLVTTPQFLDCMARAANQVGWNWRQFRRRVKRLVTLPERNSVADIEAVTRKLLPRARQEAIKLIVGYAVNSKRDLSAVGDAVEEARMLAESAGRKDITFEDIKTALNDYLIPSDAAFAARLVAKLKDDGQPKRHRSISAMAIDQGVEDTNLQIRDPEIAETNRLDHSRVHAPKLALA